MPMTPRERFVETLRHATPDRVPFAPGWPRESTLAAWHGQGLEPGRFWLEALCDQIGIQRPDGQSPGDLGADFRLIPRFEETVLERTDGHVIVQDYKGNVCEISDEYDVTYLREARDFVTRRWIRCPVEGPADWEKMKSRYRLDASGRFSEDFEARCQAATNRTGVLTVAFPGPFWQMREWCGFEGLCMMMIEQPALVDEMAWFWADFVAAMLERIFDRVVPDHLLISEDMAYKEKAMISPEMTRRWCSPAWRRWTEMASQAGVGVVDLDSDGYVEQLVGLWIEAGIHCCDPVEVAAGNDLPAMSARFGRQMAWRGGVDKRAMAAGGQTLARELDRLAPVVRAGGYIPSCDHGVPANVSWPDFIDYSRRLARLTGWL